MTAAIRASRAGLLGTAATAPAAITAIAGIAGAISRTSWLWAVTMKRYGTIAQAAMKARRKRASNRAGARNSRPRAERSKTSARRKASPIAQETCPFIIPVVNEATLWKVRGCAGPAPSESGPEVVERT